MHTIDTFLGIPIIRVILTSIRKSALYGRSPECTPLALFFLEDLVRWSVPPTPTIGHQPAIG